MARGDGERPVGPVEGRREADEESATGGSAGVLFLPPVSAIVTRVTAATSIVPAVTISNTP